MKKILCRLVVLISLFGHESVADDIEVVINATSMEGAPYLHVVLDASSTAFDSVCTYGAAGSCTPPFMTPEAYGNLRQGHNAGDAISRFEVFTAILAALFKEPQFSQLNVALLISDRESGGRILSGYKRLGEDYEGMSGAENLTVTLNSIAIPASPHNFQAKDAFYAWYRYLNGGPATGDQPPFSISATQCSKFFSIIMATESSTEDGTIDFDISREMAIPTSGGRGFTDLLDKMHSGAVDLVKESVAGVDFLHRTWVVAPTPAADLARAWASAGGGAGPINIDDPLALQRRLTVAFGQAIELSRSNVLRGFAMSAFGSYAATGELYAPLYKPLGTIGWPGNVKKFKLGFTSEVTESEPGEIVDSRGAPAIVSSGGDKGRIVFDALSFWTRVASLPPAQTADTPIATDGAVVTRGGAGQRIPGFISGGDSVIGDSNEDSAARQLWFEPGSIANGSANLLLPFNADGSTARQLQPFLGVSNESEAAELIRWGRGLDVDDEDGDGLLTEARPWIMGGVIHSKPLALNYGAVAGHSPNNPLIRIFVGTGDGIFHGIENTTPAGEESGREVFGFYPIESLAHIGLQRDKAISSLEMRYGVDGSPVTFTVDSNGDGNLRHEHPNGDEAYVYFGMRRGGYSYYALDVSDPAATPTLKWKISRATVSGDFSELGLSFSRPIVAKVKYEENMLDVLIFAGGYNGGWDEAYENRVGKDLDANDDVSPDGRISTGNAIYIVNARNGELVWKAVYGATTSTAVTSTNTQFMHAQLRDSIPSSVSALRNSSGVVHRLYVGDTGGALWRVDLPAALDGSNTDHRRQKWFISKLAELGTDGNVTDRRFFHAPDLVRSKQNDGTPFDGILISSGNRANPNNNEVVNYHFFIKDYLIGSGDVAARARPAITISDSAEESELSDRTACLSGSSEDEDFSCSLSTAKGWMIKLARPGEKGLSSPLVDGGQVYFSSYVPAVPQACAAVKGQGYVYLVNLEDASAVNPGQRIYHVGSGIPSATITLGDHLLTPLGGIGEIEEGGCKGALCSSHSTKLHKIYWRELGIDEF